MNAVTFIAASDPERALSIAESIEPQSQWASHAGLANVYMQAQETKKELNELLRAFAIDADDLLINSRLVRLLARYDLEGEALRIDADLRALAYDWLGRPTDAERAYRQLLAADPQSMELQVDLASQLFAQKRYEEAVALYDASLIDTVHGPRVISNGGWFETIWYFDALKRLGRTEDAEIIRVSVRSALSAYSETGAKSGWDYLAAAQLAAVEGDQEAMEENLNLAIEAGVDLPFASPVFESFADSEGFQSLRQRARQLNDRNRLRILKLICENNPVPNEWRPLDSTCSEVTGRAI
jgi:tetratricopeptide (TPR) repeat protein